MRRIILGLAVALTFILVAAPAAQAVKQHRYSGRTTSGGHVKIVTTGHGAGLRIRRISIATPARAWECLPGVSSPSRGITVVWPHDGRLLGEDRTFSLNAVIEGLEFHLRGTVGPQEANGTFSFTFSELGCTTGDLTWQAHRTDPLTRSTVRDMTARRGWVTVRGSVVSLSP